jgi:hypothetical protein
MNDLEIRENFHRKKLQKHHADINTLVIDELGLNHGKNRADIAVINGNLIGYEIKGNNDSLLRLKQQIPAYNSIFNKNYIIVGDRYQKNIHKNIPSWWGIIISEKGKNHSINFYLNRKAIINNYIKPISVARLLWRSEVIEILSYNKVPSKYLRKPRESLYEFLIEMYNINALLKITIEHLKKRKNWRYP